MKTTVVNKRSESFDVYIGRPSEWGNPFVIGTDGDRGEVIEKYRRWLWGEIERRPELIDKLAALDGKTLGCFCKPLACHGDVLVAAAEWAVKVQAQEAPADQ